MASENIAEKDYIFITWSINNFSYCWQDREEALASPSFCVNGSEETKWKLLLYPRGIFHIGCIDIWLCRENDSVITDVDYWIQFLASDGSIWEVGTDLRHSVGVLRNVISEGSKYLPQDILTLRFRISSGLKTSEIQQLFVRTIINVETMSHLLSIEKFSNIDPNQPLSFPVKSTSKYIIMQIGLFLNSHNDSGISVDIDQFDRCMKYFTLKTFILDSKKNKVDSGEYKFWLNNGKCSTFALKFTKRDLMSNANLYLPNDVLTLNFVFTFPTGFAFNGIEKVIYENTSHPTSNGVIENFRKCIAHENISECPCALITDLISLQKDQSACDMKLKTKTNIFPVHTLILSMRSPVFKAMFSSEMKETVNGYVDVSDLDDETVRRFLLYLYTDQLGDLKREDALLLYAAADKYAVISLKVKCSIFLKNNIHSENVCKVLTLSDLHQDKDLKVTAQNYILKNANEIFRSEEWKLLEDTYSKLAIETMSRNWIKD